jgi:hypothetical protein
LAFHFLVVLVLHLVSISWDAISNVPDPKLPGLERACVFHLHHLSQIVVFAATCNAGPRCYPEDLGPACHGISRCCLSLPLHSQGLAAAVLLSLNSMTVFLSLQSTAVVVGALAKESFKGLSVNA